MGAYSRRRPGSKFGTLESSAYMPRDSRLAGVVWRQLSQTAADSTATKLLPPRTAVNSGWLSRSQAGTSSAISTSKSRLSLR